MPMYPNLAAEMSRNGITAEKMAKRIRINAATMSAKINKKDRMKLCEAAQIRDAFFPGMSIDYLFSTELVERLKEEAIR
ncbi:hypothetical protein ACQRBP_04365 [Eubacteriales bacterium SGI.150]|uniref:XRE family transcriptional regulator n=1 Tax=Intestinimonas sp. UBA1698 TaxID=1946651 RepID=UPI00257DFD45|nr:XRE family transcriptional regulator [Intestinimonas sp. UBA1698]